MRILLYFIVMTQLLTVSLEAKSSRETKRSRDKNPTKETTTTPYQAPTPPRNMPVKLVNEFTCNGAIPVINNYRDDSYSSNTPRVFTLKEIERYIAMAKAKTPFYYGNTDVYLYQALDKHTDIVKNKSVAIIGSVTPFYESILLAYDAHPTTIEYNKIVSEDPRIEVLTPSEYDANPKLFDAIVSISSIEHDGLGRYGDPINPNGDLAAMDKAKSMLKEDGLLFLSVPVGKDCIVWNLHRVYGEIRLKMLLKGWRVVGYFGFTLEDLNKEASMNVHQPVIVLKPIR